MTTVQIKADKVVQACKQAVIVAEERLQYLKDNPQQVVGGWSAYHNDQMLWHQQSRISWLNTLLIAANASEGVVTMSVEDVGRIKEWL